MSQGIPSRIVAFGSSSVQGRGDPEGGGFVGRLRLWHEALAEENVTFNLGLAGDTTPRMLKRFDAEVRVRRPDLILLYPGFNDIRAKGESLATSLSAMEFEENITAMLNCALKLAPTIFISAFPVDEKQTMPWRASGRYFRAADAATFTEIGSRVSQSLGAQYLPVFETWPQRYRLNDISLDGLHGTPRAHRLLADELQAIISNRLQGCVE